MAKNKPDDTSTSKKPASMFSADALRLPEATGAGASAEVMEIKIGSPPKAQFIRVCQDEARSLTTNVIEIDREVFIVAPNLWARLAAEPLMRPRKLVLYVTLHGDVGFWLLKVTTPGQSENAWNVSAELAAERAKTEWCRVFSNQNKGIYETQVAEGADLPEPVFPDKSLDELLEIAFRGRMIDSMDHEVLVGLRGLMP